MGFGARDSGVNAQCDEQRAGALAHFGVDVEASADTIRVLPRGELDALSTPVFNAVLVALAERGTRFVSIDLSAVRYCNVAALRAMAELAARLHAVDGRVRIVAPGVLDRMLELADLHSLFDLDGGLAPDPARVDGPMPIRLLPVLPPNRPRVGHPHRLPTGT